MEKKNTKLIKMRNKIPKPQFSLIKKLKKSEKKEQEKAYGCFSFKPKKQEFLNTKIFQNTQNSARNCSSKKLSLSSTKPNSNSFIDYTFNESKNNIIQYIKRSNSQYFKRKENKDNEEKEVNLKIVPQKPSDFINDLNKTIELNLSMISNLCLSNNKIKGKINDKETREEEIKKIIENINSLLKTKQNNIEKIKNIKGKLVINKQINSQEKRKIDENEDERKEQINVYKEKNYVKDDYVINLLNKIREIEIFAVRQSKIKGSGYAKYSSFSIQYFIDTFDKYTRNKDTLKGNIKELKEKIAELKYKEKNDKNKGNVFGMKINKIIDYLEKRKNYLNNKIQYMKSFLKVYSDKLKMNLPNEINKICAKNQNKDIRLNRRNISSNLTFFLNESASIDITNLDMTKKLESFMDLSIIHKYNNDCGDVSNIIDTTQGTIVLRNVDKNFSNAYNKKQFIK